MVMLDQFRTQNTSTQLIALFVDVLDYFEKPQLREDDNVLGYHYGTKREYAEWLHSRIL